MVLNWVQGLKKKSHEVSARKNNNRMRYNKKCRGGGAVSASPVLLGLNKAWKYIAYCLLTRYYFCKGDYSPLQPDYRAHQLWPEGISKYFPSKHLKVYCLRNSKIALKNWKRCRSSWWINIWSKASAKIVCYSQRENAPPPRPLITGPCKRHA